jgi:hypothetical protein
VVAEDLDGQVVAVVDQDDHGVVAVDRDKHEMVVAVVYDCGAQLAAAVMERKDLEEGVGGGRQVAGEQKDQEAVEVGGSGTYAVVVDLEQVVGLFPWVPVLVAEVCGCGCEGNSCLMCCFLSNKLKTLW